MPITSEKRFKVITVTDIDIMYLSGFHDEITYTEFDIVNETLDRIEVYVRDPKTLRVLERITCLVRNMASYKFRDRQLRVEDTSPLPDVPSGEPVEVVGDPTAE